MKTQPRYQTCAPIQQRGSTTLAVLGLVAVISLVFSAVLTRSMNTYRQISHVASWQESLLAAEAGSESGLGEMRRTLVNANAFQGWTKLKSNGTADGTVAAGAGFDILNPKNFPLGGLKFIPTTIKHGGEYNNEMDSEIRIDAPPELVDSSNRQWYRIRATGTTYLPGSAVISDDKQDKLLRRLSFIRDPKTNQNVTRPQSTRRIEVIAKPISFENAIVSDKPLMMNNQQITVDSYDSRYPETSTNGLYDPTKTAKNGDVATNSQLIDAGNATVKGDAYTNLGTVANGANITGEIRDDFYVDLNKIPIPTWTTGTYSSVTGNSLTFIANSKDPYNPTRFKMGGQGKLSVSSSDLVFNPPVGAVAGEEFYVDIWVPQDFSTSGNGNIKVAPNVNARLFIEGNIDIHGNGTFNANSQPGRLQILCCSPVPYSPRTISVGGNGVIVAAIYGPDHDVVFASSGSGGQMWGSITGRTISMGSKIAFHYDEALADTGYIIDYRVRSWFEDSK